MTKMQLKPAVQSTDFLQAPTNATCYTFSPGQAQMVVLLVETKIMVVFLSFSSSFSIISLSLRLVIHL